jgi:hypothetical protein
MPLLADMITALAIRLLFGVGALPRLPRTERQQK